jgi:hypothetical protein
MPRMTKPSLPARPVDPDAAPKRVGARRTLTPGSKRTRSLMSVASSSAMVSARLTEMVTGVPRLDRRAGRGHDDVALFGLFVSLFPGFPDRSHYGERQKHMTLSSIAYHSQ